MNATRRVLYHLDKLQGRKGVVVCEGEKDTGNHGSQRRNNNAQELAARRAAH